MAETAGHPRRWISDLMAQHNELDLLGGGRATQQQEQPEQVPEDQVQQAERHGGDHAGRWRSSITAGQRQVQRSGTPQAQPKNSTQGL
jgi:hypothetical protein